jgi:predicted O-methyltransferase YrrM
VTVPAGLDAVIEQAWQRARSVPGFLGEGEARFLGVVAACAPAQGAIVEIGSFKGKSTVMLATIAAHYGLGPVVSIDPHTSPSITDAKLEGQSSTLVDFKATLRSAGIEKQVEIHCAFSRDVAKSWERRIRVLWIDGDHTYAGTKEDFDLFFPHLAEGAIVVLHDTLHAFEGPIRVFVEDILRSSEFGPAGFVNSIGWSQYRPREVQSFRQQRERLARQAARLIPFVGQGRRVEGLTKLHYKLRRAFVPHAGLTPAEWAALVSLGVPGSS